MLLHVLHQVPHAFAGMVASTLVMNIPKGPLNQIRSRTVGRSVQHLEAWMGGQPLLDFLGLVEFGVVDHDREEEEERRGVRAIECLQ